jgi:hypothetical protein
MQIAPQNGKMPDTEVVSGMIARGGSLLLLNGAHGAGTGAGTAGDAGIRVDFVLGVALRDGAHGALLRTGAAGDASISNLISHGMFLLFGCNCIVPTAGEKIKGKSEKNAKNGSKSRLTGIFSPEWGILSSRVEEGGESWTENEQRLRSGSGRSSPLI